MTSLHTPLLFPTIHHLKKFIQTIKNILCFFIFQIMGDGRKAILEATYAEEKENRKRGEPSTPPLFS